MEELTREELLEKLNDMTEQRDDLESQLQEAESKIDSLENDLEVAERKAQPQDHCEMLQKLVDYNCAFEDERHKVFFSLDDLRKFIEHPERWDMIKVTKLKQFGGSSYVRSEQGTEAGAAA